MINRSKSRFTRLLRCLPDALIFEDALGALCRSLPFILIARLLRATENYMQAMVLKNLRTALEWIDLADRRPGPGEIRVKVSACGVCRTDLHVVDGELPDYYLPIIPGHEIVGRIDAIGTGVEGLRMGERVGVPWLGHTCGVCPYCVRGQENLCDRPL